MLRIAKNIVKTLEQSVQDTFSLSLSNDSNYQLDAFFQSIPPQLLYPQIMYTESDVSNEYYYSSGTPTTSNTQLHNQDQSFSSTSHRYRIQPNMVNDYIAGLRVVWVDESKQTQSSEKADLNSLQSYFDYIVGINDMPLPFVEDTTIRATSLVYPDYDRITTIFNGFCGSTVKLNVWSAKGGIYRNVHIYITPKDESHLDDISLNTNTNTNKTSVVPNFQKLGFKVQWTPLIASTFTYHILQLNLDNGPAQLSGLIPDEDYIIGCQDGLLATGGETLLQDIVRSRANHELVLYVYNKVSDSVRPATVSIGANGRLGCSVGYGFLHRIPTVREMLVTADATTTTTTTTTMAPLHAQSGIDEVGNFEQQQQLQPQQQLPPHPRQSQKKRHAHHVGSGTSSTETSSLMAEYFQEGRDPHPAPKSKFKDGVLPPPPPRSHSASHTATPVPKPGEDDK